MQRQGRPAATGRAAALLVGAMDLDGGDFPEWMAESLSPSMKLRLDAIQEVRRRCGVSQNDAVRALNSAGRGPGRENVALACQLVPQVCADSERRREAARQRQQDDSAEIDFIAGDEVAVRGLQRLLAGPFPLQPRAAQPPSPRIARRE